MACFLIHNFIRSEMVVDPIEEMMNNLDQGENDDNDEQDDYVDFVEATPAWNHKRDELAQLMWQARN